MNHRPNPLDWGLLLLLSLIWGSSFILMKKGLESFRPEQVACMRMVITAVVLSPFAWLRRSEVPKGKLKFILLQGLFGNFIPAFLFTAAQQYLDSSLAGILNSLSPVFVFIIGILFFKAHYNWMKIIGMAIAFSGTILLLLFQNAHGETTNAAFGGLIVLATLSYGTSTNIIKSHLHDVRPITITAISFAMLFLPAFTIMMFTNVPASFRESAISLQSLGYISILAIAGTAIASALYNKLLHRTTALFAASVTYVMPIVAVMWGLLAGETIGVNDFAGMALIVCGVYLVGR